MSTTSQAPPPAPPERRRRVFYSLLGAVIRVAYVFGMSLREVSGWLETAYFHYLRGRGMTLPEIAKALDVSPRKASMLSKQLRESFFGPEAGHGLPRRVEFLLWTEPMSLARLQQLLRKEADGLAVEEAIGLLLEQDRVRITDNPITTTYAISATRSRMYRDDFAVKIDGLNHYASVVANVTLGRFESEDPRSFARTATLRVRPQDFDALQSLYQDVVWAHLTQLDDLAHDDPTATPVDVTVAWAPYQLSETMNLSTDEDT